MGLIGSLPLDVGSEPTPNSNSGVKVIGYLFTTTADPSRDPLRDAALLDSVLASSLPLYGQDSIGLPISDSDPRLDERNYESLCLRNGVSGIIELTILRLRDGRERHSLILDTTVNLRRCDGTIIVASEYRASLVDPDDEPREYSRAASHIVTDILRKATTMRSTSYVGSSSRSIFSGALTPSKPSDVARTCFAASARARRAVERSASSVSTRLPM